MMAVALSTVALWVAPLLYRFAKGYSRAHAFFERVIIAVLAGLVVVHILPLAYKSAGWPVFLVALWGMLLPSFVERAWHSFAKQVHWVPFILGTAGLALHAGIDGTVLATASFPSRSNTFYFDLIAWAIIAHRLPEGLFIWWTLTPRFGWKVSASVLALISCFTLVGYALGEYLFIDVSLTWLIGLFQALVAGSLLHLALDWHDKDDSANGHIHHHDDHRHNHRHDS
jgi:zinc transporter ZupT